jgi:hypothetical protein
MKTRDVLVALAATLLIASPLALAKGYAVQGYVGDGMTTPVAGQQVTLIDRVGQIVGQVTTGWTGGFKFRDVPPGDYFLLTGEHHIGIKVDKRNVRQDFDLSAPDGRLSYTQNALQEFVKLLEQQAAAGQQGARSGGGLQGGANTGVLPSRDETVPGTTDCWAAAGCSYDSGSGTYEMSD